MSDDEGCYQTLANIADSVRVRMMEQSKGDTPWKPVDEQVIEVFQRYEAEITRLQELHLERTKLTTQVIEERDRLKEELAECRKDAIKDAFDIVEDMQHGLIERDFTKGTVYQQLAKEILALNDNK